MFLISLWHYKVIKKNQYDKSFVAKLSLHFLYEPTVLLLS